ncbi:unnamed protein product [Adineta steineri]|uniref:Uncharacterized protein n=1 Tax=Adineta steineri TaxID=433720 RepID=A0A818T1S5_9BILA|nr:unnamed protein product [Adineta steineri]
MNGSISNTLLETNYIWDIHHDFDFDSKRFIFKCKSSIPLQQMLDTEDISPTAECILNTDFVTIEHEIPSEDDTLKLESTPNDICSGVGIWNRINTDIQGTICLFMHKTDNGNTHHYCLTAKHVIQIRDDLNMHYSVSHKHGRDSNMKFYDDDIILSDTDAVALRVTGDFICRFPNLNCLALKENESSEESIYDDEESIYDDDESNKQDDLDEESNKQDDLDEESNKQDDLDQESNKQDDLDQESNKQDDLDQESNKQDDLDDDLFESDADVAFNTRDHGDPSRIKAIDIKKLRKYYRRNKRRVDCGMRIDNSNYRNLIEVKWLPKHKFAEPGDSGSLYYIYSKKDQEFIPIAMHVGNEMQSILAEQQCKDWERIKFRKEGYERKRQELRERNELEAYEELQREERLQAIADRVGAHVEILNETLSVIQYLMEWIINCKKKERKK